MSLFRIPLAWLLLLAWLTCAPLTSAAPTFERPVPEDGGPTTILCAIAVLDLDDISDASQNFTVNLVARFQWHDPREAHEGKGKIVKELSEIWHPHLFFVNMQRTWSTLGGGVEISPSGEVVLRQQFWGDFSQPLALHDFPFDQQVFEIKTVTAGPEEFGEIALIQDPEVGSFITENYSVANWEVTKSEVGSEPLLLPGRQKVEAFTFRFTAARHSNHYVIKIIAPLLMIVILSWVVFWLDPSEGGSQLGVAVTSFLTVIAYHVALSSKLPEISYLTRFDVFVFGSTLLVFFAMLEVVLTTGMARTGRIKGARWLDRVCRVLFPGILTLVGLYAFVWH